ncbi:MAG: rhodanese-like domain-containing protein [Candidatus Tectimicrobiota bacterium]
MQQTIQRVTVDDVHARLARGDECQLVDVREVAEYEPERIAAARLVPLPAFEQQAGVIDPQRMVYVVCRSGNRALQAAARLLQRGYMDGRVVEGGLQAWKDAGYPVQRGTRRAWSLERQVRCVAGVAVLLGVGLSWVVHPGFLALAACIGAGLTFSAVTDTCGMAMVLARMPWNHQAQGTASVTCTRA